MSNTENINWENYPLKGYGVEFLVSGMEYICVRRYREQGYNTIYNKITSTGPYHYYLLGTDNQIVDLDRYELLPLMQNSQIKIKNLKLSANDSILEDKEYYKYMEDKAESYSNFKDAVKEAEEINKNHTENVTKKQEVTMVDKDIYQEEIRKGMFLIVTKTTWRIKYSLKEEGSWYLYPNGVIIEGLAIDEHILEIKECYEKVKNHILTLGGEDWSTTLFDGKYDIKYNSEVGKFMIRTYKGQFVVSGEKGVKQWIKDVENCPIRVEEIRNKLGWKRHKGLLGKVFGAY